MLTLLFQLGSAHYAIPAREVAEVTPLASLDSISAAPDYVAGLLNYRGQHVPVIDLHKLLNGEKCEDSFTTRLLLVHLKLACGETRMLGLIAERITETRQMEDEAFCSTGLKLDEAPYLGKAVKSDYGLIQKINIENLIPDAVRDLLYPLEVV